MGKILQVKTNMNNEEFGEVLFGDFVSRVSKQSYSITDEELFIVMDDAESTGDGLLESDFVKFYAMEDGEIKMNFTLCVSDMCNFEIIGEWHVGERKDWTL